LLGGFGVRAAVLETVAGSQIPPRRKQHSEGTVREIVLRGHYSRWRMPAASVVADQMEIDRRG
jgi:hypothetical protein